jgi:hypothetical protein
MTLVVTQVGLDKATQADVQGVNLKITHVAVGLNGYTPDNTMTALQNEFARVAISGGKNINDNQVHLTAMFEGEGEINGREIGFYLEDGTLFAIDSHPTDIILYKSATTGARALEGFDLVLDGVPPNSITVDITGDIVINFDNEFKQIDDQIMLLQFAPYNPLRTYKTGETCTIEVAGEVIAMQMYAGPNLTCVGKDPADLANRHEQWPDSENPFWWIPYTGTEVGMPFWWLDVTPPETAVMEINADLPIAVYWRLARRYPDLITGGTINTGEIRGEFLRVLDQGRGIDPNRVIGEYQKGTLVAIDTGKTASIGRGIYGIRANTTLNPTGDPVIARNLAGSDPQVVEAEYYSMNLQGVGSSNSPSTFSESGASGVGGVSRSRNIARAMAITI